MTAFFYMKSFSIFDSTQNPTIEKTALHTTLFFGCFFWLYQEQSS